MPRKNAGHTGKPSNNPKGRDPLPITKEQVLKMAERHLTVRSMADILGCDEATIYRRCSASEIAAARDIRPAKLKDAIFQRAMGGRVEKKNDDGSITIYHLKSSDRMAELATKIFIGLTHKVELNPNPQVPANVHVSIDPEQLKAAIEKLESDY